MFALEIFVVVVLFVCLLFVCLFVCFFVFSVFFFFLTNKDELFLYCHPLLSNPAVLL